MSIKNKKHVRLALSGIFAGVMSFTSMALAETQGVTGTTSTGDVVVSLIKGEGARISGLRDFNFGPGTSVPVKDIDDICIYSTTGSYNITASSNGNGTGGPQFRMTSATTTEFVRYFVEFRDDTFSQNGDGLAHNVASATYSNADTISDDCAGGSNSRLIVEVDAGTFNAATPDTYTDTLTLLVQPI